MSTETEPNRHELPADASTDDLIKWLTRRACDPDIERIALPFWRDKALHFTNGRILVWLDCDAPPPDTDCRVMVDGEWVCPEGSSKPPDTSKARDEFQEEAEFDPPPVDPPDSGWSYQWEAICKCDECGGIGEVICNYECYHDCPDCDGKGMASAVTEEANEIVEFCGEVVARRYMWLISQLPGVKLSKPVSKHSPISFKFIGGAGMVMPMIDPNRV